MPAPIPDTTRAAILADIQAGQKGCNAIAREHGVSPGTVENIARDAGLVDAFARTKTENATRARQSDLAARRAVIAEMLLDDIQALRDRAWQPYQVVTSSQHGAEITTLELPPLRDAQAAYTSIAVALDKHLALVRHDGDTGGDLESARSLLGDLGRALGLAADQLGREYETPVED
jgi:hypothetical protein